MDQNPWHVLHVSTNQERKVAKHLSVRSLENYLPSYTERSRWTDRTVLVERPLFRGYVFVRFTPETKLAVISTPGIIRLLGDGRNDTVTAEEIKRIREGLAGGYLLRPHPNVSVGTPVRVRNGIFEGVEGVVTDLRERCKVIIALSAVRQCFSLELSFGEIEVLAAEPSVSEKQSSAKFDITRAQQHWSPS